MASGAAFRPRPPFFDPAHQRGLTSLLSQTYGKPVKINLVKLHRPQENADIMAQHIVQRLKDRKMMPRRVLRDAAWKPNLPSHMTIMKQKQELLQRAQTQKPLTLATLNHGPGPMAVKDVVKDLALPQVTSVAAKAAGRLSARITANRAQGKEARRGLTNKGETQLMRGTIKARTSKGMRAGKRRIGSYGIQVTLGHSP